MTSGVSVVIPTYNRAQLLPYALESALRQSVPPLEIIVVDDGSTDDTATVCARYPTVRYLPTINGGVGAARNAGIAVARGEWVALLDSDDEWVPEKLAVQLAALAATPECRWSITGCELIDGAGQRRPGAQSFAGAFPVFSERPQSAARYFGRALREASVSLDNETHQVFVGDLYDTLFLGNVVLPSSALIHQSVFSTAGVFDPTLRLAEETEYFHRVAARAPVAVVLSPLVRYRVAQIGALTGSRNAEALSMNALRSLACAAALRTPMAATTSQCYAAGRTSLSLRLAYARLSELNTRGARAAVASAMSAGAWRRPRAWTMLAATMLPVGALRAMHWLKRTARR